MEAKTIKGSKKELRSFCYSFVVGSFAILSGSECYSLVSDSIFHREGGAKANAGGGAEQAGGVSENEGQG